MIYSGLLSGCARSILLILVASVGSDDLNINNQLKPREHALLCRSQDMEKFEVQILEASDSSVHSNQSNHRG